MLCKMCLAKLQLETYECVIFDKRFVQHANDDTEITQGTWKMSHQEAIIKSTTSYWLISSFEKRSKFYYNYVLRVKCNSHFVFLPNAAIFQYVRGTDAEAKEDGKTLIKMLDAMKSEFKVIRTFEHWWKCHFQSRNATIAWKHLHSMHLLLRIILKN